LTDVACTNVHPAQVVAWKSLGNNQGVLKSHIQVYLVNVQLFDRPICNILGRTAFPNDQLPDFEQEHACSKRGKQGQKCDS